MKLRVQLGLPGRLELHGQSERKLPRQCAMGGDQERSDPRLLTRRHAAFGIKRSEKFAHGVIPCTGIARR
jgi:hypothetical protein